MLEVSLDIETECGLETCPYKGQSGKNCDHALQFGAAHITKIGIYHPTFIKVFNSTIDFDYWRLEQKEPIKYIGHNLKFDLKILASYCSNIPLEDYLDDTQIMASVCLSKVSPEYITWYGQEREKRNKSLPKGYSHRAARPNSLKVLAPYFLNVKPFWEDPTNHANDEYVLKDCEYTYKLRDFFRELLKKEGLLEFYQQRMMPWTRMITEAEIRGITVDLVAVEKALKDDTEHLKMLEAALVFEWKEYLSRYRDEQKIKIINEYTLMYDTAKAKSKKKDELTLMKLHLRYIKLQQAKIEKIKPFNFNSPDQLKWLFKECLGLDITDFDDEESTGKRVLNRLASEGRKDIKLFLEYRKYSKLVTSFYPSYKEMADGSIIHCNFNPAGTRTGRLSSSTPNLQQVPGHLHKLFKARPGYRLITRDQSAVEPRVVAYYTQDPTLCSLILHNGDFHSHNALIMLGLSCEEREVKEKYPDERKIAKTSGLALIYGAKSFRIQQTALSFGLDWPLWRCKEIYENFRIAYETAFNFKEQIDAYAVSNPIETYFGRKHAYPDPSDIYMKAFNTLVQSTASDLLLEGSYRVYQACKKAKLDAYPLLWVHDEVVFEVLEQDVLAVEKLLDTVLIDFSLPTPYGNIPLKVEGKTSSVWEK